MDIAILSVLTLVAVLVLTGKPIKIEITHKQEIPPATEVTPLTKEEEEDLEIMNKNAREVMKKFNEEWSGLTHEEE